MHHYGAQWAKYPPTRMCHILMSMFERLRTISSSFFCCCSCFTWLVKMSKKRHALLMLISCRRLKSVYTFFYVLLLPQTFFYKNGTLYFTFSILLWVILKSIVFSNPLLCVFICNKSFLIC